MAADISVAECNERLAGCSQLAELLGSSETELFKEVGGRASAAAQLQFPYITHVSLIRSSLFAQLRDKILWKPYFGESIILKIFSGRVVVVAQEVMAGFIAI